MSRPTPPTCRMTNWRAYNAALKQRRSLQIWFDPETAWLAEPSAKRGRLATFTDAAIQACLTLKALFGLPLRQTTGLVESLLKLAGLDWSVPDFSTLSRRQKGLNVATPYQLSTGALHLLIPSRALRCNTLPGSGQHRDQSRGRRRVVCQETRAFQAASVVARQVNACIHREGAQSRSWD